MKIRCWVCCRRQNPPEIIGVLFNHSGPLCYAYSTFSHNLYFEPQPQSIMYDPDNKEVSFEEAISYVPSACAQLQIRAIFAEQIEEMTRMQFIDDTTSGASFSPCRTYRYSLWRMWEPCEVSDMCAFVCLNPSTADETKNDPTVTRCINFSKAWGFKGFVMLNLFAFRATDPKVMKAHPEPIGPDNDEAIRFFLANAGRVVFAWGNHGDHLDRCFKFYGEISVSPFSHQQKVCYLELTKKAQPKHPLYIKATTEPVFEKLWR